MSLIFDKHKIGSDMFSILLTLGNSKDGSVKFRDFENLVHPVLTCFVPLIVGPVIMKLLDILIGLYGYFVLVWA